MNARIFYFDLIKTIFCDLIKSCTFSMGNQCICLITVYTMHLVDMKFGESVCDINWRVFSMATRAIQITYGYGQV